MSSLPTKAEQVHKMFAAIAPSYDLNNRLHSLWLDQHWRSVAVKMAEVKSTDVIIDVACGTGDLTLKFANMLWHVAAQEGEWGPHSPQVFGVDFTSEMLQIAERKAASAYAPVRSHPQPTFLDVTTQFINGDALCLPLPDQSADIVSIAFGIRNLTDPAKALQEFARILRPGGRLIILEFASPPNPIIRRLYNFYFHKIMPITATLISRDKSGAYKYLPESVNTFITPQTMQNKMQQAGFANIAAKPLSCGICVCYKGVK